MLATRWATATADRTTLDPGQPGVRLRFWTCARRSAHRAEGSRRPLLVPGRAAS
ncbi:DUF6207 family protein [Streptomyces sp. NPDC094153]|uniref:DUF6207 family protein n=1 Tax=Streptomyces sp. NPDC094153 TaxID=3366058 RepID=UPI0037F22167